MHTPLIAHTADDSLTIYTGLYGDRHGMPVSNSYKTYNPDGTTESDGSFVVLDLAGRTTPGRPTGDHDRPRRRWCTRRRCPREPAHRHQITPAPWVPFTRAGCTVGDFSTANMVLENATVDIPTVFGADSPEAAQTAADPALQGRETAEYVGEAVHCAQGDRSARTPAVKFGQRRRAERVTDALPTEPGGYTGLPGAVRRTSTSRRRSVAARRT